MSLDQDFAWSPGYFSMTAVLNVLEVYWSQGGKNDIIVNVSDIFYIFYAVLLHLFLKRIVANCTGIAMVMLMVMFLIIPGIYDGLPNVALLILDDSKRFFKECIELTIKEYNSLVMLSSEYKNRLKLLYGSATTHLKSKFDEAINNYSDANILKYLCVLKVDPQMHYELDSLAVLGSANLSLISFTIITADVDRRHESFTNGTDNHEELEQILLDLQLDQSNYSK